MGSKTERNKVTAKRLNEFVQIIESAKNEKDCDQSDKINKGELDKMTGIEFEEIDFVQSWNLKKDRKTLPFIQWMIIRQFMATAHSKMYCTKISIMKRKKIGIKKKENIIPTDDEEKSFMIQIIDFIM